MREDIYAIVNEMSWDKKTRDLSARIRAAADAQKKLLDEAQNALAECLDYFEDRYDVNWEGDGPNKEMRIGREVAAILAKLEARDA